MQSFAILTSVPAAAAIIHIKHSNASAGPILDVEAQGGSRRRGGTAMTLHQKRRKLIIRRPVIAILRRVIKAVCGVSVARRKLNRLWCRKVVRIQNVLDF